MDCPREPCAHLVSSQSKRMLHKVKKLLLWLTALGTLVLAIYMMFFLRTGDERQLQSTLLNEARTYSIYLPNRYDADVQYPVLYSLDGEKWRHGAIVAANASMLAAVGLGPEVIVVAVHAMGQRGRDYRPSHGAEAFVSFLESELIPEVEQAVSTSGKRILSGHSYGGLFTLYSMTARPNLFDAYFAYDPSILADEAMLQRLKVLDRQLEKEPLVLYMNYGFHSNRYEGQYEEILGLLEAQMKNQVASISSYYPLPHSLIMLPGQVAGLRYLADHFQHQP